MSIKFPDMQVLVGRTDQIPRILREGDPTGAGKLSPIVAQQFTEKPRKISHEGRVEKGRNNLKENKSQPGRPKSKGSKIDVRV